MRLAGIRAFTAGLFLCVLILALATPAPNAVPSKTFLGFDTNDYPGDDALPLLRKIFLFAGYWLGPPPGAKGTSWLGKRAATLAQGFGLAVLWNGRDSHALKSVADAQEKGRVDAHDAARVARQEGFPAGTVIFLDVEEGGRLGPAYHAYVHAWIDTLAEEKFAAGVYCSAMPVNEGGGVSITTAQNLKDQLAGRKLVFWIYNDACPPAPGCGFPQTPPAPSKGGFAEATIWQFAQSPRRKQFTAHCAATYAPDGNCYAPLDAGHKWFLDVEVSDLQDPSAPRK